MAQVQFEEGDDERSVVPCKTVEVQQPDKPAPAVSS